MLTADLQDSAETQYQTNSSGNITNAGGFHFAQGTTLLSGGPAGNDFNAFASLLLGLPQDAGKIYQFQDEYFSKTRSFALYIRDRWRAAPNLTVDIVSVAPWYVNQAYAPTYSVGRVLCGGDAVHRHPPSSRPPGLRVIRKGKRTITRRPAWGVRPITLSCRFGSISRALLRRP